MGNFRGNQGGGRGRSGGSRFSPRSGGDRFEDRGRPQMHDAICQQCKSRCQVPFRPTGTKPVFCSNCFRSDGTTHRNVERNDRNAGRRQAISQISERSASGISQEQFTLLNRKLDTILRTLEMLEIDTEGAELDDEDEEEPEEDDDKFDDDDEEIEVMLTEDADDEDEDDDEFEDEEAKPSY